MLFRSVLSGCGAEEADRKRLELQRAVGAIDFEAKPGTRFPLGISIGAAVFPHDGESYEKLLATADARMYRNKASRKAGFTDTCELPLADLEEMAGVTTRTVDRTDDDPMAVHRPPTRVF